jgi:Protein of unknown function (DUF1419)
MISNPADLAQTIINPCVFCEETNRIIDFVAPWETFDTAKQRLASYGSKLVVLPLADASSRYENSFKTDVEEISAADFNYALECLPPVGWRSNHNGQVFRMSERMAGNVTAIYVAQAGRFFKFYDDIRLPHDECCKRVHDFRLSEGA